MPGFQSFFTVVLHHFVMAKLATSNIRVKSVFQTACSLNPADNFGDIIISNENN